MTGRGDIIQPSDRFGDAVFREKWRDERIVRAVQAPRRPGGAPGSGMAHDDEVRRRFCRLYADGMTYIRIGREMNISRSAVARLRKAYGLPMRTNKAERPFADDRTINVTLKLTDEMDRAVTDRCRRLGRQRSRYLRGLIQADLDRRS